MQNSGNNSYNSRFYDWQDFVSTNEFSTLYRKLFIQPNIGFKNKHFDIAFSSRISGINFMNVDVMNWDINDLKDEDLYYVGKKSYLFMYSN